MSCVLSAQTNIIACLYLKGFFDAIVSKVNSITKISDSLDKYIDAIKNDHTVLLNGIINAKNFSGIQNDKFLKKTFESYSLTVCTNIYDEWIIYVLSDVLISYN